MDRFLCNIPCEPARLRFLRFWRGWVIQPRITKFRGVNRRRKQPIQSNSNKTKLVYLIPSRNELDESTVEGINEALDQQGAPYFIEFQALSWSDSDPSIYGAEVREHMGSADLLFTGWPGGNGRIWRSPPLPPSPFAPFDHESYKSDIPQG